MDLRQDVKTPPPPIDSQPYQPFQQSDVSAVMNGTFSDTNLPLTHPSHMSQSASPMFPPELRPADPLALSMQLQPATVSSMDVVSASMPEHMSTSMHAEFPPQTASVFLPPDPPMNGIETVETSHQMLSSPSTTTASTNASLVSSPSVNGMVPSFMMGSSSLASALDGSRSRSASSASPGHLNGTSSELGFSSGSSAPSTTFAHEPAFPFTFGYEKPFMALQSKENSPDAGDPHLLALGDMLKK